MVLKTREKLIEVARQLFAHKGVENTTMNDIAAASDKGRRTIYTYFKNKREIYNAVIERESENLLENLREVKCSNLSPAEKLAEGLKRRFEIVMQLSQRHDSIRIIFYRDLRRIDRIRKLVSEKEKEIFNSIIEEGIKSGEFEIEQAKRLPSLVKMLLQGNDYFNIKADIEERQQTAKLITEAVNYIVHGILIEKQCI
ncbi:MAG: TetR/AcrR family transcriptional regulator [Paramuribaculum sp.]|nr:TetR/AcrR family transcriptional regulator [Paramuribaculum sp.]MDE5836103.1 TetR/AcrR family transcriptional regulator [Paramuribaculum sp.]